MIDITKVKEEAEKEIREEKTKDMKDKVKRKLLEIEKAQLVVSNLKSELQDIYASIS